MGLEFLKMMYDGLRRCEVTFVLDRSGKLISRSAGDGGPRPTVSGAAS
jgi:hypothetical protein